MLFVITCPACGVENSHVNAVLPTVACNFCGVRFDYDTAFELTRRKDYATPARVQKIQQRSMLLLFGSFAALAVVSLCQNAYEAKLVLPVALILWAVALCTWPFFGDARRREERARLGLCLACGYNLTGNVSGICPECGTKLESTASTRCE